VNKISLFVNIIGNHCRKLREWAMPIKLTHLIALVFLSSFHVSSNGASIFNKENQVENMPSWLYVSGSQRIRYESLNKQFRSHGQGSDQQIALRTLLALGIKASGFNFVIEAGDSRAFLDDNGSHLSTNMINPIELIQGYLMWEHQNLFEQDGQSSLRVGRLTIDVGSRRLVARSKFRNTMNTFSGAEWKYTTKRGNELQMFYTLPVNRIPDGASDLKNNHIEYDRPSGRTHFWGVSYTDKSLIPNHEFAFFSLGLHENDTKKTATSNRDLITTGITIKKPRKTGDFDYLLESVYQFGESRKSKKLTDEVDLEHFAHFHHVEIGFSAPVTYTPRLALEYDYASGDSSANDGRNGRFDSLFGARRFDYGPTGIYGPFKRSNLNSIGLRISAMPTRLTEFMSSYRGFWRASKSDAWVASGINDIANVAPRFIGQQLEVRLRWKIIPRTLQLELGSAYLRAGKFSRIIEPETFDKNIYYGYAQLSYLY
jgi:hypothetical protein